MPPFFFVYYDSSYREYFWLLLIEVLSRSCSFPRSSLLVKVKWLKELLLCVNLGKVLSTKLCCFSIQELCGLGQGILIPLIICELICKIVIIVLSLKKLNEIFMKAHFWNAIFSHEMIASTFLCLPFANFWLFWGEGHTFDFFSYYSVSGKS